MEFAFFWVIFSLSWYSVFKAGIFLYKPTLKSRGILYLYLILAIGVFLLNRTAGTVLAVPAIIALVFGDLIKNRKYFYPGIKALSFAGLIGLCYFYLPAADRIWVNFNALFLKAIKPAMPAAAGLTEVFEVARFLRFLYPAFFAAGVTIFILFIAERHYASFWHRFLLRFNHRQIMTLAVLWTIFGIFEILGDVVSRGIFSSFIFEAGVLNVCLYFSFFYIIYGFLIINHLLKKRGFPVTVTSLSVYGLLIISGGFIVYLLTLLLGIGVSDVWMDYTRKKIKKSPV